MKEAEDIAGAYGAKVKVKVVEEASKAIGFATATITEALFLKWSHGKSEPDLKDKITKQMAKLSATDCTEAIKSLHSLLEAFAQTALST